MLNPDLCAPPRLTDRPPKRRNLIRLTPLIDVVFILLVFFMLASSFLDWRQITLDNPAASNAPVSGDEPGLTLVVSREGINRAGKPLSRSEALAAARDHLAQYPDRPIRVQPAGDTPLQAVIILLDALNAEQLAPLTLVRDPQWQDPRETR